MGLRHYFDIDVAKEVGTNAAVLLENIAWWVRTNEANERNLHDGKYWTYNSVDAFAKLFPYLSKKQIRTALDKLEEFGYLETGCFNEQWSNRTKWYTVTDKAVVALGDSSHFPDSANGICQKGQMSTDENGNSLYIYTDINTAEKPDNGVAEQKPTVGEIVREVISYLNEVCGTSFKPNNKATHRHINRRLQEGFTVEDFRAVIDDRYRRWGNDPKMREYLQPNTLFCTKFEGYLYAARLSKKTPDYSMYN